jgi:hypothetical protein
MIKFTSWQKMNPGRNKWSWVSALQIPNYETMEETTGRVLLSGSPNPDGEGIQEGRNLWTLLKMY